MEATSRLFGRLPDGRAVEAFSLRNALGMSVDVTTYGAIVLSVKVPAKAGGPAEEVTLCHSDLEKLRTASPYFGATVGRVANRVAKGAYVVDGRAHAGAVNNGANHLHGGLVGFDKVLWAPRVYVTPAAAGVEFSYTSPAGEEGYPGTLTTKADYRLTAENELIMEFTATTDAPTPVNICNHTCACGGVVVRRAAPRRARRRPPLTLPPAATSDPARRLEPLGRPEAQHPRPHAAALCTLLHADGCDADPDGRRRADGGHTL